MRPSCHGYRFLASIARRLPPIIRGDDGVERRSAVLETVVGRAFRRRERLAAPLGSAPWSTRNGGTSPFCRHSRL